MRDAYGGVGGVDTLSARAGAAEGVDADVLLLDLHVNLFGFGQDGDSDRGGVHAALGFGRGNALHAMYAGLVLHLRVDLVALEDGGDFLQAADVGRRFGEDLDLPAVLLGEA